MYWGKALTMIKIPCCSTLSWPQGFLQRFGTCSGWNWMDYFGWGCHVTPIALCRRHKHKRSWTNPFGDESFGFVAQGNLIAYRSAILIAIALVRRIGWFLENPGGSRCVCLPVIQQLINHNRLGTMQIRWWGSQLKRFTSNPTCLHLSYPNHWSTHILLLL